MKKFLFGLLLICIAFSGYSQETQKIDVNKDIALTKVYEQVIKEGYGTPEVYLDLANAHYFEGNYVLAKKWYEKRFETHPPKSKVVLFRYRQSLKALQLDFKGNKYLTVSNCP